jgi:hypothetical protein
MSSQAAYDLSIPELLHVSNERLDFEYTGVRDIRLPPAVSVAPLETEVSDIDPSVSTSAVVESDSKSFRSKASKLESTIFWGSSHLSGTSCSR